MSVDEDYNSSGSVAIGYPCGGSFKGHSKAIEMLPTDKMTDFEAGQADVTVPNCAARVPDRFTGKTPEEFRDWASAHCAQTMNNSRMDTIGRIGTIPSKALGF